MMRSTALAVTLLSSLCLSQTHKCDWSVVGVGGGEMASSAYRCGATAGQTAAGTMTGTSYQAFIGFWQIEEEVGIKEAAQWPSGRVMETRLYAPQPNPFRSGVKIRYSLATEEPAMLQIYDHIGRVVRAWAVRRRPQAASFVTWDGKDNHGRVLPNGVYFLKFTAGDYRQTAKLVVQR